NVVNAVKSGKKVFEIGNDIQLDWKQVSQDAKKLNGKIDQDLYQRFLDKKAGATRDQTDGYLLTLDGVIADNDVSQRDMNEAEERFVRQRDRADDQNRRANGLTTSGGIAARRDNIRDGGLNGNKPPAALSGTQN